MLIHRGDALQDTERAVLDRWDAGDSLAEIAFTIGIAEHRAKAIVEKFDSESNWQDLARAASQRLAAACLASGGSFA